MLLLYNSPDARFQGVSTALLGVIEARARVAGLRAVTARSTATARRFYERRGYEPAGEPVRGTAGILVSPMRKCWMAPDAGGDMVQGLLEVLVRGVGWIVLMVVTLGRYRSAGSDAMLFEGAIGLAAVGALLWATYAWM